MTFTWPGSEAVLQDSAAPQVEEILTRDGHLEIGFSEEVDLTVPAAAITIDGTTVAWELDASGYRLQTVDPLESTAQSLTIGTGVQDLAGTALAVALTVDLTDPIATADTEPEPQAATAAATLEPRIVGLGTPGSIFYRIAKAGRLLTFATGNRFGFHGRELDFATGLVYFRNRWYDPELGRFIQQDPLGYVDAPSLYHYALNNPVSFSDPTGLIVRTNQKGLAAVIGVFESVGRSNLAATLRFENGVIEIAGPSMLAQWVPSARKDRVVKLLFRILIDQQLEVDLQIVRDPGLVEKRGGVHPEPRIISRRGQRVYLSELRLDPDIIGKVRLRRDDGTWIDADFHASLIHEFAHAFATKERNLVSTMRVQGRGPTDEEAVEYEDAYRRAVGLPLRGVHGVGVICPSGKWDSVECQARLWCGSMVEISSDSEYCQEVYRERVLGVRPERRP